MAELPAERERQPLGVWPRQALHQALAVLPQALAHRVEPETAALQALRALAALPQRAEAAWGDWAAPEDRLRPPV